MREVETLQFELVEKRWTLKSALTASKRRLSSGNCSRMSAEPKKMDTKACHFFCKSDQVPKTRSTVPSFLCQVVTLSKKTGFACTN